MPPTTQLVGEALAVAGLRLESLALEEPPEVVLVSLKTNLAGLDSEPTRSSNSKRNKVLARVVEASRSEPIAEPEALLDSDSNSSNNNRSSNNKPEALALGIPKIRDLDLADSAKTRAGLVVLVPISSSGKALVLEDSAQTPEVRLATNKAAQ